MVCVLEIRFIQVLYQNVRLCVCVLCVYKRVLVFVFVRVGVCTRSGLSKING